jgi:hypothetical protein
MAGSKDPAACVLTFTLQIRSPRIVEPYLSSRSSKNSLKSVVSGTRREMKNPKIRAYGKRAWSTRRAATKWAPVVMTSSNKAMVFGAGSHRFSSIWYPAAI